MEAIILLQGTSLLEGHNSAEDNPMSAGCKLLEERAGGSEVVVAGIEVVVGSGVVVGSEVVVGSSEVVVGSEVVAGLEVAEVSIIKDFMVVGLADITAMAQE
jgi:hypothetical protein